MADASLNLIIDDDEVVYRRVPAALFDGGKILDEAMMPHRTADPEGLSLTRASLESAESLVARARRPGAGVFSSRVGAIRALGLSVVASPNSSEPGHAHIPEMNSSFRPDLRARQYALALVPLFSANPIILPQNAE